MPESDVSTFEVNPNPPPRPFAVASWLGTSPQDILAGLADGSIAPPPGAPPDWRPPGLNESPIDESSLNVAPLSACNNGVPTTGPVDPFNTNPPADDAGHTPDRASVLGWFQNLDPSLGDAAFDAVWNRAGDTDAQRATNLTDYLARTLLGGNKAPVDGADQAGATGSGVIGSGVIGDALSAFVADPSHHAHIVDLAGMDGATLERLGRTDVGYRYAMQQLDTVALTGNRSLFAAANGDSALDRFDPDTGETQLSDAWLGDRAKFLAWKMAGDAGNDLTIGGDQSWTFIDRAKAGADGLPLTLKLTPENGGGVDNQVIFGADSAEAIKGKSGTDRIYGGGGDDLLRGGGGADHLEGGHGDDVLAGGSGNDELSGNQGSDDLDGGRGADALDGGSGDDILAGGRGNDFLAGGGGIDTYVIDAGDGTDTITDTDGRGSIVLDDATLAGATRSVGRTWTSADGRVDYTLEGNLAGEGTLTIRAFSSGADHAGNPDNIIHVNHWRNGDLGIALQSDVPTSALDDASPPEIPDPPPATNADAAGLDAQTTPSADSVTPDTGDGQTAPTDAPPLDLVTSDADPGIDGALAQFLSALPSDGSPVDSAGSGAVNPAILQQAVADFTGVPVPPDTLLTGTFARSAAASALSLADVAGALAADAASDDLAHESASGMVPLAPDWHMIEAAHLPQDTVTRGSAMGMNALVARK